MRAHPPAQVPVLFGVFFPAWDSLAFCTSAGQQQQWCPEVCPELCACGLGSNFLAPHQWGSEGTWMSADCEAVFNTASVIEG